jgi:precorrin-3B synthase
MAFGHIRAPLLAALVAHAVAAGAHSFVPAGRRVLLALGLPAEKAADFATAAERRGFVARVDDPRRFLAACAGAPDCPSGRMAARRVALEFTEILAPILDGSFEIHVSGCAKGCAHPGPAAVTLVGTDQGCGVVLAGRADGTPVGALPPGDLPRSLAQFARSIVESRRSGERSGDVLRRLGGEAVSALLIGETADG